MANTCLIIDKMHPSVVSMLQDIGWEADYQPDIPSGQVKDIIENYQGLIVRSKLYIGDDLIKKAFNLKFVARAGAGLDNIDEKALKENGIPLVNAPEGNRDAVAEHALGLMLSLLNKIVSAHKEVEAGSWLREANRGIELGYKTVGIVGYGNMGRALAQRLKCMGCEVLAYDKYLDELPDPFATRVTLEELFEKTDILTIHTPLTSETKGWVDKAFLNRFRKNIWLINTARGEILVLKDLLEALDKGKVQGAGLDVLQNEKINKLSGDEKVVLDSLMKTGRVIITPHVAGWSYQSYEKINKVLIHKIQKLFP